MYVLRFVSCQTCEKDKMSTTSTQWNAFNSRVKTNQCLHYVECTSNCRLIITLLSLIRFWGQFSHDIMHERQKNFLNRIFSQRKKKLSTFSTCFIESNRSELGSISILVPTHVSFDINVLIKPWASSSYVFSVCSEIHCWIFPILPIK